MKRERQLFARHLKEMLELVEDPESDLDELRYWFRSWPWEHPTEEAIAYRLERIEQSLGEIENRGCSLDRGGGSDTVMRFITGMQNRLQEERKYVTSWLSGCQKLTIVDPYFFSFGGPNKVFRTVANYMDWLESELIPRSAKEIDVFHLPGPNGRVTSSFKNFCQRKAIRLRTYATNEIHDRVLIRDGEVARVLGTSFGGLGNKIAFMLDLPGHDLEDFKGALHRIVQAQI